MSEIQLYANGRAAVLSAKLFGADKFARLKDCHTVAEALKILYESGYGNGASVDSANDYEVLLRSELDCALKLFKELCYDKRVSGYVVSRYDYLNAKTLMKCKYMRVDGLPYCFLESSVSPKAMQDAFVSDDYSQLSKNMAEACDEIDTLFAEGKKSPRIIDKTLDKAMFADMRLFAKKCRVKFVKRLFDYEVNTVNILTAYRLKRASASSEEYSELIIDGGSISRETLLKLWDNEQAAIDLPAEYKSFYALCASDKADLLQAETARSERIFDIISEETDLLSVQPVLDYFYRKVREIDEIRRILVGIKAGQNKDN